MHAGSTPVSPCSRQSGHACGASRCVHVHAGVFCIVKVDHLWEPVWTVGMDYSLCMHVLVHSLHTRAAYGHGGPLSHTSVKRLQA